MSYVFERILDSVRVLESTKKEDPNGNWLKEYQIKVDGLNENLIVREGRSMVDIYNDSYKVADLCFDNNILEGLTVIPNYQGLGLGDFLVNKAVNEYGCDSVRCGGTRAYKLYKKYGFVPEPIENIVEKLNNKDKDKAKKLLENLPTIRMKTREKIPYYDLLYKEFEKFVDENYKGVYE